MRLVHLSDLHLGYRQYQRLTPAGINQREADVAAAFRRAVDKVIALAPELVVIAGDVFHNVRPTNPAILHSFHQFARLTAALPGVPVVIVAGNHDTPRAADLAPDPDARHNVLLLHGEVEGMLPAHLAGADRAALEISTEQLGAHRWGYVALGHYHVYREIAPNAYYSGSLEYTSANTWGELIEERQGNVPGKGMIEHDLATEIGRAHV